MAAEMRQDRYVFSSRVRFGAAAYAGVTSVAAVALSASAHGQDAYLIAWALVPVAYAVPALGAAFISIRQVAPRDRLAWRLWCAGWCVVYSSGLFVYLVGVHDWGFLRWGLLGASLLGGALFGVANTAVLHMRGGQRVLLVDLVDLATTVIVVIGPVVLLVGQSVVDSQHMWLTLPASLVVIGLVHGCTALLLLHARLPPERRRLVQLAVLFCVLGMLDAAGQAAQGISDFTLPTAPLIGVHALCMGGGLFIALFAIRRSSRGLERLPPQEQVRKNGILGALVLVSTAVMGVEALWRREHVWVVVTTMALVVALLVLSTIRQHLLASETVRLYGEVERAAAERRELLAEVMRSVDSDRHGAALQLHTQAASLYVAMGSFGQALLWLPGEDAATSVGMAAERVRFDLGRRVDASQQMLHAIEPASTERDRDSEGLQRLVTLTRAYIGNLWGDVRRPELAIDVDEHLVIDWMLEVVVFRIVQVAVHNIWRHAEAGTIRVSVTAPDGALTVQVDDDGVGFETGGVEGGTGMETMQTLAAFVDGHVEIDSSPGGGTRVCAVVSPATPRPRPRLRVVPEHT